MLGPARVGLGSGTRGLGRGRGAVDLLGAADLDQLTDRIEYALVDEEMPEHREDRDIR